jgi:hypothetical protein
MDARYFTAAPMITNLQINSFVLSQFELHLCAVDTHINARNHDEGSMMIRVEGEIGDIRQRLNLIDGVVPHARQTNSNLTIRTDKMPENALASVVPLWQSIPTNHVFVLVWESDTPYFIGISTGRKYTL